jgi:hypothetical protein
MQKGVSVDPPAGRMLISLRTPRIGRSGRKAWGGMVPLQPLAIVSALSILPLAEQQLLVQYKK